MVPKILILVRGSRTSWYTMIPNHMFPIPLLNHNKYGIINDNIAKVPYIINLLLLLYS